MVKHTGRHFLQIPGPTSVPDRVLRAIDMPMIDHRGSEFADLAMQVLSDIKTIFKTDSPVIIFPSSGSGAWEAALVNTLSPGEKVLMFETGHFSSLWEKMAKNFDLDVELIPGDWRTGVDPALVEKNLQNDTNHRIKAVCVVHNETSTGVTTNIKGVRGAIDTAEHPALLMVDTVSSLGAVDYRHDEWKVDVTVSGSQKGLMLPPGLGFTAISKKALEASEKNKMGRAYWSWKEMLKANETGFFPYTPAVGLLYGLKEAIAMLHEEGLNNVFARHARHGEATRRALSAWGLENMAINPDEHSNVVTTVLMPKDHDADSFRKLVLDKFDMSLGAGLGKVAGKVFRIGHIGHHNDLMLAGALAGVEMGLRLSGIRGVSSGVDAALEYLAEQVA
ncbi:MAG: serine--glyoxylate aminotransferase [Magnetovibrio sp.]|nr:serine--glyoxylate aminotransferase [Magnetovibrio sp.]